MLGRKYFVNNYCLDYLFLPALCVFFNL